jgi:hypothetical protein
VKFPIVSLCLFILLTSTPILPAVYADDGVNYTYMTKMTYTNQGESDLQLPEGFADLALFPNTTWQTTILTHATHPFTLSMDDDQNLRVQLGNLTITSGSNITVSYSIQISKSPQTIPPISLEAAGSFSAIPSNLDGYIEARGSWEVDDPELQAITASIWAEVDHTTNVLKVVGALADWIGTHIEAKTQARGPLYPSETCNLEEGDCDDQANLLITLCRILGIPAYLRVGAIHNSNPFPIKASYLDGHMISTLRNIGYHGWAMIYIPPWGWLPFDMTLGWSQNSLTGITTATAWKPTVLTLMNIQTSDWVGDWRNLENFYFYNDLYLVNEDQLIRENSEFEFEMLIWVGIGVLISGGSYLLWKRIQAR